MRKLQVVTAALLLAALAVSLVAPMTAAAAPLETAGGPGCAQFYRVVPGDNLFRIALRFGTTVPKLMVLNGLSNPNLVYSGMTLCVKSGGMPPGPPPGGHPVGFHYVVRWGDTMYSIALRYGWSVAYLSSVNHLANPWCIYAGQVLLIPYH